MWLHSGGNSYPVCTSLARAIPMVLCLIIFMTSESNNDYSLINSSHFGPLGMGDPLKKQLKSPPSPLNMMKYQPVRKCYLQCNIVYHALEKVTSPFLYTSIIIIHQKF